LCRDDHIAKLVALLDQEELVASVRLAIANTFLIIVKNLGLRKIFLKREYLNSLSKLSLSILEEQENPNKRLAEIGIVIVKALCTMCTVKTNRFYIPGETSLAESLRKKSFDTGIMTLLTHIHANLNATFFKETKTYIQEKVLQY